MKASQYFQVKDTANNPKEQVFAGSYMVRNQVFPTTEIIQAPYELHRVPRRPLDPVTAARTVVPPCNVGIITKIPLPPPQPPPPPKRPSQPARVPQPQYLRPVNYAGNPTDYRLVGPQINRFQAEKHMVTVESLDEADLSAILMQNQYGKKPMHTLAAIPVSGPCPDCPTCQLSAQQEMLLTATQRHDQIGDCKKNICG